MSVPAFVKNTLLPRHTAAGRLLRRVWSRIRDARPRPPVHSEAELLARMDEFNRNAETYWQAVASEPGARATALAKPLTTVADASSILYRLGMVLNELQLGVGHTVLDLGAGACWLSSCINRLRCHTISMDVSPKALELGEELFRLDPRQRLDLAPRFLAYDGRRFPLAAESVDRIVCFDAFHHVPNEDEILAEMFRVLRRGGRAVFAEPGEGHSHAGSSLLEAQRFQVLENELDLRALTSKAKRLGFTDLLVKPYPDAGAVTLSADEYFRFMDGDDRFYPLDTVRRSLRSFYVFILLKGPESFDSRNPKVLRAAIEARVAGGVLRGAPREEVALEVSLRNAGDTVWLHEEQPVGGYVRLGGHLVNERREPVDWDFFRAWLPASVAPGETVTVEARVRLPDAPGRHLLRLDLVDEGIAWFEQSGSPVTELTLIVD